MLVGLYLFMPIMSAWLTQAKRKDVKIFLGIWIFSMVLPYVQMLAPTLGYEGNYGNMGILGICDWNPYGMFYNFAGFMGYMVLAHYLMKYPLDWNWKRHCPSRSPCSWPDLPLPSSASWKRRSISPASIPSWRFCGTSPALTCS